MSRLSVGGFGSCGRVDESEEVVVEEVESGEALAGVHGME